MTQIPSERARARMRTVAALAIGAFTFTVLYSMAPAGSQIVPESESKVFPEVVTGPMLKPAPHWPVWLRDLRAGVRTDESSAIEYLGRDSSAAKEFFIADDIGVFHVCRVSQPGDSGAVSLEIDPVTWGQSLITGLDKYERWDFEALAVELPRPRGALEHAAEQGIPALLSIEGHGEKYREHTTIMAIRLINGPSSGGWRVELTGEAWPGAQFFRQHARPNAGIEGLARGDHLSFAGLGGLAPRGEVSSEGTVLYIYDRGQDRVAYVGTHALGIRSITGIDAVGDSLCLIVDRDREELSLLRWDRKAGQLTAAYRFPLDLPAPENFRYSVPSIEGLAIDDDGDIWFVTDPWEGHYRAVGAAPETLQVLLEARLPMLYRMSGAPVWETAGVAGLWPLNAGAAQPGR